MAGFISAERIEAGSIATSKLEPDAGNHLVISGNPSITQINNQIAPGFSTETSYVTGDLVMKDGIVYIFTSDHPAGAWDDSDVLATNVATQIELLPDKIIQYVGQQGYGRTFIQWTDPALDPEKNVAPGDYWIKQDPNTGTWGVVKNKTWGAVKDSTWYDLMNKMPEMYCRKGSGLEAEWVPVNDTKAISEAYTRIEQTQFAIIQEAYRANAAEGELSSKIIQTAEGILQEVRQEVSSGYIAKTSTYQTADAIVTTAEQYTASRLTNYYTKTETASQISTSLSSYTYSKGDLYTKANVYSKADVYTKTETASQVTTSISSYTYSKSDLYKKSEVYSKADVYTKTETASQISTSLSSYTYSKGDLYTKANVYSKADVYTKTETASQVTTSISSYTYSKSDLYKKSEVYSKADVYTKTETASQISTSLSSYTYSKSSVYTKTETASQISTSISTSLGNYYTKTETATQISTYVGNHAYGLVSGITITADGINMTGSKYIKLVSGNVRVGDWYIDSSGITCATDGHLVYIKFGKHPYYGTGNYVGFWPVSDDLLLMGGLQKGVEISGKTIKLTGYENGQSSIGSVICSKIDSYFSMYWYSTDIEGSTIGCLGDEGKEWNEGWFKYCYSDYFVNTSSREIKHNIEEIPDCGDILDQLTPVTFIYNNDEKNETHSGLIYEDAVEILPDICTENRGVKGIRYPELIPYLLKEIQSLRKRVAELESSVPAE